MLCCCLHIKPFFLPNMSSTPSVRPDSSSREIQILWLQRENPKNNREKSRYVANANVPCTRAQHTKESKMFRKYMYTKQIKQKEF